MVDNKLITVGATEYRIVQLGALEGRRLWLRLLKTISSIIGQLATKETIDEATMAAALKVLVSELDEQTYEMMCTAFSKRCEIHVIDDKGDRWPKLDGLFDQHFAGDYIGMSQWLGENILFNFANFSGDASLGKLIAAVKAKAAAATASKSKSQTDSIGTSGAL